MTELKTWLLFVFKADNSVPVSSKEIFFLLTQMTTSHCFKRKKTAEFALLYFQSSSSFLAARVFHRRIRLKWHVLSHWFYSAAKCKLVFPHLVNTYLQIITNPFASDRYLHQMREGCIRGEPSLPGHGEPLSHQLFHLLLMWWVKLPI